MLCFSLPLNQNNRPDKPGFTALLPPLEIFSWVLQGIYVPRSANYLIISKAITANLLPITTDFQVKAQFDCRLTPTVVVCKTSNHLGASDEE